MKRDREGGGREKKEEKEGEVRSDYGRNISPSAIGWVAGPNGSLTS